MEIIDLFLDGQMKMSLLGALFFFLCTKLIIQGSRFEESFPGGIFIAIVKNLGSSFDPRQDFRAFEIVASVLLRHRLIIHVCKNGQPPGGGPSGCDGRTVNEPSNSSSFWNALAKHLYYSQLLGASQSKGMPLPRFELRFNASRKHQAIHYLTGACQDYFSRGGSKHKQK